MYEEFFQLKNRPFAPVGPVESFVGIGPLGDALQQLQRAIAQCQSIALLIGENGSGKSHLCKYLAMVETASHRPVYLSTAGFHTRRALLQAMLYELGENYVGLTEQEARLKLLEAARKLHASRRKLLLILDEAHLLSPKMYEELRTLIDHAPTGEQQIQLILAGSMELEEQLFAPELQAFNQRVGAQVVLEPLTLQQSAEYIDARLRWAGADSAGQAISEQAMEMICRASDGNIRCLNQLADHALLLAYVEEVVPVTADHVTAALKDLKALPLHFNSIGGPAESLPEPAEIEATEAASRDDSVQEHTVSQTTVPVDEQDLMELFGQPEGLSRAEITQLHDAEEQDVEHSDEECSAASVSEASTPQFSVLEVGAGIEETPEEQPVSDADETAMDVVESPLPCSTPSANAAATADSEMQEFGITDHYARLDDQFNRADGYLSQLAWNALPELPSSTLGSPADDPIEADYVTGDASHEAELSAEEQLLKSIQNLHDELDGMIEHRPAAPTQQRKANDEYEWLEYDVVQPGCTQDPAWIPEESSGEQPASDKLENDTLEQQDIELPHSLQEAVKDVANISPVEQSPVNKPVLPCEDSSDARSVYELLFDRLSLRRRQQQSRN